MRLFLLSTVSTAALVALAAPAIADDTFSGVGEIFYGVGSTSSIVESIDDSDVYGIKGKGYWPLSPEVHLQADLFYERNSGVVQDWGSASSNGSAVGGAVHLLHGVDSRARIGIAGQVWNNDVWLPAGTGKTDATYGLAALEGQFFGTDWTLSAQGGMFTSFDCSSAGGEGCPGPLDSGTFVRVKARYFLYDNTSISLENTQMWGKLNDEGFFGGKNVTNDYTQWVFEMEHKFDETPYAGAIGLEQEGNDILGVIGSDVTTFRFSFRYYLNESTLKSNDRTGPQLDLPTFGNAPETTGVLSEAS